MGCATYKHVYPEGIPYSFWCGVLVLRGFVWVCCFVASCMGGRGVSPYRWGGVQYCKKKLSNTNPGTTRNNHPLITRKFHFLFFFYKNQHKTQPNNIRRNINISLFINIFQNKPNTTPTQLFCYVGFNMAYNKAIFYKTNITTHLEREIVSNEKKRLICTQRYYLFSGGYVGFCDDMA